MRLGKQAVVQLDRYLAIVGVVRPQVMCGRRMWLVDMEAAREQGLAGPAEVLLRDQQVDIRERPVRRIRVRRIRQGRALEDDWLQAALGEGGDRPPQSRLDPDFGADQRAEI